MNVCTRCLKRPTKNEVCNVCKKTLKMMKQFKSPYKEVGFNPSKIIGVKS